MGGGDVREVSKVRIVQVLQVMIFGFYLNIM